MVATSKTVKEAVAFIAGYSPTSSGYTNLCGALRSKGFIVYPSGGAVALTDDGRIVAQPPDASPTTEYLHRKVLEKLSSSERKLMEPLLRMFPGDLSNEDLAMESGYSVTSSGFTNIRGRLRTLGLVEYPAPGRVKARSILFLE